MVARHEAGNVAVILIVDFIAVLIDQRGREIVTDLAVDFERLGLNLDFFFHCDRWHLSLLFQIIYPSGSCRPARVRRSERRAELISSRPIWQPSLRPRRA